MHPEPHKWRATSCSVSVAKAAPLEYARNFAVQFSPTCRHISASAAVDASFTGRCRLRHNTSASDRQSEGARAEIKSSPGPSHRRIPTLMPRNWLSASVPAPCASNAIFGSRPLWLARGRLTHQQSAPAIDKPPLLLTTTDGRSAMATACALAL